MIQDWERRLNIRLKVRWRQNAFARRLQLKNWHHWLQLWLHLCWLNLVLVLALLVNRSVVVVAALLLSHRSQSWQLRAVLYKLQIRHGILEAKDFGGAVVLTLKNVIELLIVCLLVHFHVLHGNFCLFSESLRILISCILRLCLLLLLLSLRRNGLDGRLLQLHFDIRSLTGLLEIIAWYIWLLADLVNRKLIYELVFDFIAFIDMIHRIFKI